MLVELTLLHYTLFPFIYTCSTLTTDTFFYIHSITCLMEMHCQKNIMSCTFFKLFYKNTASKKHFNIRLIINRKVFYDVCFKNKGPTIIFSEYIDRYFPDGIIYNIYTI